MLKAIINKGEFQVELNKDNSGGSLNGNAFSWDMIEVKKGEFHIIKENKSFRAEVLKANLEEKSFTIRVNGNKYVVQVSDKYDELLKSMGIDALSAVKVNELKAPMPGLVLDILVSVGAEVKKGEPIIVLEAMKMENVLKSPADVVIKKINVEKRQAVEKNQVLISFQ